MSFHACGILNSQGWPEAPSGRFTGIRPQPEGLSIEIRQDSATRRWVSDAAMRLSFALFACALMCSLTVAAESSPVDTAAGVFPLAAVDGASVAATAAVDAGPIAFASVSIGLKGSYQLGRWTPVEVELSGTVPAGLLVRVATRDSDGNRVVATLHPVDGAGAGRQRFHGVTISGRIGGSFRLEVADPTDPQRLLLSRTVLPEGRDGLREFRQSTLLWLMVGNHPGFFAAAELAAPDANPADRTGVETSRIQTIPIAPESLPTRVTDYDAVHTVILDRGDLSPERGMAIKEWVELGGNLVVVMGEHAATFQQGPMTAWLPVRTLDRVVERQTPKLLASIAVAAPNNARLLSIGEISVVPIMPLEGESKLPGKTLIDGPATPVAIRAARGLGTISVVGIDLAAPPFAEVKSGPAVKKSSSSEGPADRENNHGILWSGLPKLCLSIAGVTNSLAMEDRFQNNAGLSLSGTSDMQSQWNVIVEEFPQIPRWTSGEAIGLMALILLIVGPVDYLLVHRILKRPHWTWFTLPIWIAVASGVATSAANRFNSGPLDVNQFDLIDVAVDTGQFRSTSWVSFYSPESKRYAVSWQPDEGLLNETSSERSTSPSSPTHLFGMQLPEEGFRGMYRRGGMAMAELSYHIKPMQGELDHLPVDVWSSRAFVSEHAYQLPQSSPRIAESSIRIERLRSGARTLKNWSFVHHLPVPIHDWFIVSESQVIYPSDPTGPFATLEPGREYDLTVGTSKPQMKTYIQGQSYLDVKKNVGSERYLSNNAYDPANRESDRFLRTLTFFQGVGGEHYTGLTNSSLSHLDLSEFAHLDRAILFGRIDHPAGSLSIDGVTPPRQRLESYLRMVVPVVRETQLQSIADEEQMLKELKQK